MPETNTSAAIVPSLVSSRHSSASLSHRAEPMSWPKRMWGVIPYSSAQRLRYDQISGWFEKVRVQSGLGANENE